MKITRPETLCLPINAIEQETVRAIYRTLIGRTLRAAKAPFRRLYEAHSAAQ